MDKISTGASVPEWLRARLRNVLGVRKLAHWLVKGRDVRISTGAGAGLKLNAAASNPSYALGTNELPVQQALLEYLSPASVFYDIGANIGFFSVIAARLVGPTGQVFAFEPLPENAAAIQRNITINAFQNVTLFQSAVSNTPGTADFLVSHYSGGSALATASTPPDIKEVISVELVTIDQLLEQRRILPPRLVKIDVEGAELQVLQGMPETIRTHSPVIIFEIDDQDRDAFLDKQAACQEYLTKFGYTITQLEESYPGIEWQVGNYLALPPQPHHRS